MLDLLVMCAPAVNPITMAAVVKQESGGHPWVLNNNTSRQSMSFRTKAEAVSAAVAAIAQGQSVDMGLAQINSKNLPGLELTVEQVFDPCTNVAAGARILGEGYRQSRSLVGALSNYNTGRFDSKPGAAYAQKVFWQAGVTMSVPAIPGGQLPELPHQHTSLSFASPPATRLPVVLAVMPSSMPSPFAAELSPGRGAFLPAAWR